MNTEFDILITNYGIVHNLYKKTYNAILDNESLSIFDKASVYLKGINSFKLLSKHMFSDSINTFLDGENWSVQEIVELMLGYITLPEFKTYSKPNITISELYKLEDLDDSTILIELKSYEKSMTVLEFKNFLNIIIKSRFTHINFEGYK